MSNTLRRALAAMTAALLAAMVGAIAAPGPAHAGGWAATVLEPMPAQLQAHQTYTVGTWVLQHGFHPYEGDLSEVALQLIDSKGTATKFAAVKLKEPAHYAVSLVLPHDGPFTVVGIQGWFAPYEVGTISAKAGLRQLPGVVAPTKDQLAEYWPGPVKPPVLPVDQNRDPFTAAAPAAVTDVDPPVAIDAEPVANTAPSGPQPWLLALAAVAALFVAGTVLFGRWRIRVTRRGTA
ncbi:hypothetical protein Ais01nite_69850 [Asanoa ishikariensis]|uniref:Uncharacterized protein n=1 Tax=Asanoa ishikariensis TaxID=137265 RepID=A0A1H3MZE8_9ACTN|nr:hypothetical protein [Asanoa ishikariensis]GIF68950.1 hypothetical protein Ais01nite_69850 [Asanoa ishikariensis]SDY82022.1 hypothetical protein SAMN05421684_1720 [Asanoa ishikariensis]